jgi:hypothetical protein
MKSSDGGQTLEEFGKERQAGKGTGIVVLRRGRKVRKKWGLAGYCFSIESVFGIFSETSQTLLARKFEFAFDARDFFEFPSRVICVGISSRAIRARPALLAIFAR